MSHSPEKKEDRITAWAAATAGWILILGSASRLVSLNNLYIAVRTGDIPRALAASLLAGWALSAALLFLVGTWLLFLSGDLKRRLPRARYQALIISCTLSLYGAAGWYQYPGSIRLAAFLFVGLALLVVLLFSGKPGKKAQ